MASNSITLRMPSQLVHALPTLSLDLQDRMHAMLERNTNGDLNKLERRELETLVHMTHFAQLLLSMTLDPSPDS